MVKKEKVEKLMNKAKKLAKDALEKERGIMEHTQENKEAMFNEFTECIKNRLKKEDISTLYVVASSDLGESFNISAMTIGDPAPVFELLVNDAIERFEAGEAGKMLLLIFFFTRYKERLEDYFLKKSKNSPSDIVDKVLGLMLDTLRK